MGAMSGEHGLRPANASLTRGYGTLGGLAFVAVSIFAVPSTLLLEPLPPAEAYFLTLAGLTTGFVCLALPWERLDPRWLHLFGALATVEAAWAVAVFGPPYVAFFFTIAVSVAYVTPNARRLLAHLFLIGLALLGPVAYGPQEPRAALQTALVVYPTLVLTAGIFAYLRQRMVADSRSYRRFAEETLGLADRIAGRSLSMPKPPPGELDDLPAWSRFRFSARVSALAAGVFAVPLVIAGLAAAGVRLPSFAADTFGRVGIDLPNQMAADDLEPVLIKERGSANAKPIPADGSPPREPRERESDRGPTAPGAAGGSDNGAGASAPGAAAAEGAAPEQESSASGASEQPEVPGVEGATDETTGAFGHALEETLGLAGLLGGERQPPAGEETSAE